MELASLFTQAKSSPSKTKICLALDVHKDEFEAGKMISYDAWNSCFSSINFIVASRVKPSTSYSFRMIAAYSCHCSAVLMPAFGLRGAGMGLSRTGLIGNDSTALAVRSD